MENNSNSGSNNNNANGLPPGFRFNPTDEELVLHFLYRKASQLPPSLPIVDIPDLDLSLYDPWQLHGKGFGEGNQRYFFSRKTQNRITDNGYWTPLFDNDEEITTTAISSGDNKVIVGMKKSFVFHYTCGIKTNWFMHEFRLTGECDSSNSRPSSSSSRRRGRPKKLQDYSKWVLCRVYERNDDDGTDGLSCLDEVFLSLDDLDEISFPN